MPDFKLPDVGEGLTEAEIVSWKVQVGDEVDVNDVLVEIETAKSLVELPSPYAGAVTAILVAEGEVVAVGTSIITVGTEQNVSDGQRAEPVDSAPAGGVPTNSAETEQVPATLVGYGPSSGLSAGTGRRRPRRKPAGAAPATVPATTNSPAGARPLAKPPVRKLAQDLGVDLATVTGTGAEGRISYADVEAAQSRFEGESFPESSPGLMDRREPVKGVRKAMAQAMTDSAFTIPHVTEWITIDVTRTVKLLEQLRELPEFAGVKVSPLLLAAKAVLLATQRTPEVNAVWDESTHEIVYKSEVNLGIAVATPRGLLVPNLKDAQALSLPELARALADLSATAKAGRTQPADQTGGTFTITNIGVFGIDSGTPLINPGSRRSSRSAPSGRCRG